MYDILSPEEKLAQSLNKINQFRMQKDYKATMAECQVAIALCQQINNSTKDQNKKKLMRENAIGIKSLYQQCADKLGERQEKPLENGGSSRSKANKPSEAKKEDDPNKLGDDIEYTINGIDVKQFLVFEANKAVMFKDVVGMEAEKELIESEFFLTDEDRKFREEHDMDNKRFMILYGVPGTGKTYFAKAISNELKARYKDGDCPFFSVVGLSLKDSKVGATENNIIALFEFCKQFKQCVLYIDEFEALVPSRTSNDGDPTAKGTVTTFLQMIDGFSSASGTLLICATNYPQTMDAAIISRADAKIEVPLPTEELIYGVLSRKISDMIEPDVDLHSIAKKLNGYSNRDLQHLIAALKDEIYKQYRREKKQGINKASNEYLISNDLIDRQIKITASSVSKNDLQTIYNFKHNIS